MKEIWINLELYFESYDFYNFLCISGLSEFNFNLNLLKIIQKIDKKGLIFARDPRGCNMACKATWQSHTGPCERLRGAEVTWPILVRWIERSVEHRALIW